MVVDSGSTDGSAERARAAGARRARDPAGGVRPRPHAEPGRRARARRRRSSSRSQDAVADDASWLARLVAAARSGRERRRRLRPPAPARRTRTPPERFFLDFLYGPEPARASASEPGARARPSRRRSSRTSTPRSHARSWSAYPFARRPDDERGPGVVAARPPRRATRSSTSRARRSATRTRTPSRSAFRRFFDSGVSAEHAYVEGDESRAALRRAGARYAREELAWLWRDRAAALDSVHRRATSSAKFAGLQLGLRHHRLPRGLVRRLGSYDTG